MPDVTTEDPRSVLDRLPNPVVGFDRDGRHDFVNPAACRMVGRAPDQLLGRTLREIGLPSDLAAELDANVARVRDSGQPFAHAVTFPSANGPAVLLVNLVPRPDGGVLTTATDVTGPARAEQALRDSEERYRQTIEAAFDAIVTTDAKGTIVGWNRGAERVFGHPAKEVLGRDVELIVPPRYAAEHHAAMTAFDPANSSRMRGRVVELPALRKGGIEFPTEITLAYWGAGADRRFTAIIRDITARRAAEQALRDSEERHRLLVESVTDYAIFMLAPDGRVATWNAGAQRIKGYTADEIVGRHFSVFYLPENTARAEAWLEAAAASGRFAEEGWRVRKDGSRFWAHVAITALRDPTGRLTGFVKVTRDLTDRLAAEQALRESEQRYRQVVEDQTETVCRFRPDGTFTFVNDVYCRTFGKRADELIGRPWHPVVHPADLDHVETELTKMAPDNPVVRIENRIVDAGGRARWMEFVNRGFYSPAGELVEIQAVGRDVTDRRAAEDARRELEADLRAKEQQARYERQLLQSQKLESLGVLAGGIAHDFNNLLTAVLGYASLSRMRLPPNDPVAEDMKRIESAAQRAAELCQQMLAYAGRGQFVVRAVDLNALTQEMTQLLAAVLSKKAVLKYNLTIGLPQVQADPTQLRQIVMNLITNASDAIGPKSGVITLTTGLIDADARYLAELQAGPELVPGRYVYLEVSDTGCGMSEEVRAKIFDPFFTTKFTGRGLGLAAVQGIVRAHKGAIKVYTQLGKGTTFKVLLPALDRPDPEHAPAGEAPEHNGRGRRVLVVDDEEDVRVFTRKVLEHAGFEVTLAADGGAGVEAFAAAPYQFALVLLDLTMPKMGGSEAFREMRRHRSGVRVVLTSGFAAEEATSGFEGKGLAGFLRKPFRTEDLLATVFDAIGS
ncbi:PAS domain S-box protein [Gemmata sp. JC673]|uniref:histidine kinase n=1 Tax=Gemmata algarum TaxID=2975278 RepID=A0ABU5F900_9BACT|nr:PAS domain S-box protein [Gemmata algarum]